MRHRRKTQRPSNEVRRGKTLRAALLLRSDRPDRHPVFAPKLGLDGVTLQRLKQFADATQPSPKPTE